MILYYRYVPHARVEEYEALGWIDCGLCPGHHGVYSRRMKWERQEEVREPEQEEGRPFLSGL